MVKTICHVNLKQMNKIPHILFRFLLIINAFEIKGELLVKKDIANSVCDIYEKMFKLMWGMKKFDRFYCSVTLVSSFQATTAAHRDQEIISNKRRTYYQK